MKKISVLFFVVLFSGCLQRTGEENPAGLFATDPGEAAARLLSEKNGTPYPYYLYQPKYKNKSDTKYPILIFLHGRGEVTGQLSGKNIKHGPLKPLYVEGSEPDTTKLSMIDKNLADVFVLVPSLGTSSDMWERDKIDKLLDTVIETYPIDTSRIYVTGLSIGGIGVWSYAAKYWSRLAAIVPVSSASVEEGEISGDLKNLGIWAFHCINDNDFKPDMTINRVLNKLLNMKGSVMDGYPGSKGGADDNYTASFSKEGKSKGWVKGVVTPVDTIGYTVYKDGFHDAWTRTYSNSDVYKWLLSARSSSRAAAAGNADAPAATTPPATPAATTPPATPAATTSSSPEATTSSTPEAAQPAAPDATTSSTTDSGSSGGGTASCQSYNRDGRTCEEAGIRPGETKYMWGGRWQCVNGCAKMVGGGGWPFFFPGFF
ncbi:MAG: hypothetical protein HQK54_14225 [Oligoflexales bacterium]|nr:hypothetical protein [Oligoflexales bacterium]